LKYIIVESNYNRKLIIIEKVFIIQIEKVFIIEKVMKKLSSN